MSSSITPEVFTSKLTLLAKDLQSPAQRRQLLGLIGDIIVDEAKKNIREGHTPAGAPFAPLRFPRLIGGGGPLDASGRLPDSFSWVIVGNGVALQSTHPGARLHMHGGVVRPRRRLFLAIPLTAEAYMTPGGPLQFARELHPQFRRGVTDRGVLADPEGVAQFALVKQVIIQARPYDGPGPRTDRRILDLLEKWYTGKFPGARVA
jgi:phage gpG-like protein